MALSADEFMRRFLLHVLPARFHRIRHYGLFANPVRRDNLAKIRELFKIRELLHVPTVDIAPVSDNTSPDTAQPTFVCRHCGSPMIIIDILQRSQPIRAPPAQRGAA
jgi:hypothetical protein